ncbi:MAG: DNA ligase D [Burkholderiaceae bacterium]|nr:DNA ligase D [Burkholderiaceae bacterium]
MARSDPLQRYRARRRFDVTPEPPGTLRRARKELRFVVHKHAASHLHYDLRLELDGVFRSWAVPKGPSLDPGVKRMAIAVEDHPLAYGSFEGVIPPGQYGAGTVIVWDRGAWRPLGDAAAGLAAGKLEFELVGHKLSGRWKLVRLRAGHAQRDPAWLLIKARDAAARPAAAYDVIAERPESVLNGVAADAGSRRRAPAAALPLTLAPQLATRVDRAPDEAGWTWELKLDGYRLLARIQGGAVQLITRGGHDWTSRLASLARAVGSLGLDASWLDGEIVVLDEQGVPNFQKLQNAFDAGRTGEVVYYLFDLPFHDGQDLRGKPLAERRDRLGTLLAAGAPPPVVRFSEAFEVEPAALLRTACRLRIEGLIGKRLDAPYQPGRSTSWIKLKCTERQEFVVVGYTDPQGSRVGLGALLLGVHETDGTLRYAGRVGTGFDAGRLRALAHRLAALRVRDAPFDPLPADARGAGLHWVRPVLVAEVSFAQWTRDGRVRQAVFHGLRDDKPARAITRERAVPVARAATAVLPQGLRVTHPQRIVDPSTGTTKLELLRYHAEAAPALLAQLRDRPVSLVRAPDGVGGEIFFQKHAGGLRIPGMRRLDPELDPGHEPLIAIPAPLALLGAVQMNVIEFHTWNARTRAIDRPDRMVFDIDPGERVPWPRVQEAATLLRGLLQELELASLLKTSGGKGLHVIVPLQPRHDWDTVKSLARAIVVHLAGTLPQRFVARSGPKNRVGRIFVDYLRNGRGATTVAAWSVRARPGLGVSVPVRWDELDGLRSGAHWTVRDAGERLALDDPWAEAARWRQTPTAALRALDVPAGGGPAPRRR